MGRRSDHSREEIREMCVQAATERIAQGGLQALSARNLASDIGYTAGTLYQVFKNLDEVVIAVNQQTLQTLERQLRDSQNGNSFGDQQLKQLALAYIAFARSQPRLWLTLFEHRLPNDTELPPALSKQIDELFSLVDATLDHYPQVPASERRLATHSLWSSIHGICVLSLNDKLGDHSPEDLANDLIERYMYSLLHAHRSAS